MSIFDAPQGLENNPTYLETHNKIAAAREKQLAKAVAENERLRAALNAARRDHVSCDDGWYSCPMHPDGCLDESATGCNCGADEHNAAIDIALGQQQRTEQK